MLQKHINKINRKRRIRASLTGTTQRPRLAIYRSNRHLFVQLIDDQKRKTLVSERSPGKNTAAAKKLGKLIAEHAKKKSIKQVVFDRGGNKYHGVIAAIADSAREGGLKI